MGEMTEALAQLDSDGDGSVGIAELLRIPVIRVAILLQNPALLTPAATTDTEGKWYQAGGDRTETSNFLTDNLQVYRRSKYEKKVI